MREIVWKVEGGRWKVQLLKGVARIFQLEARTENEKAAIFAKQKSSNILVGMRELFCEGKMAAFSFEFRSPTEKFWIVGFFNKLKIPRKSVKRVISSRLLSPTGWRHQDLSFSPEGRESSVFVSSEKVSGFPPLRDENDKICTRVQFRQHRPSKSSL